MPFNDNITTTPAERKLLIAKIGIGLAVLGMIISYTYVWIKFLDMEAARDAALFHHNFYRSRHGSAPLRRNADLDMLAQMCASYYKPKGMIDHSCPYYKSGINFYFSEADGIGENGLGVGAGAHPWSEIELGELGTWAFYKETYNYNFSDFKNDLETHFGNVGHFTEILWRDTREFGLGYTTYTLDGGKTYGTLGVFLYSPAGNVLTKDKELFIMNVKPVIPGAKPIRSVIPRNAN
ncbi:unnamed protein product [Orchesella dallaii]|uniref:SCP domain-containing protein n=1 Tax=Orchesella dallaii TaxID=48710 RepID=A0ABP1RZB5_9HEXA